VSTAPTITNARHVPNLANDIAADLLQNWGQWRQLGRLYCPDAPSWDRCTAVRGCVDRLRHLGFTVEGDRQKGYRVVDVHLPARAPCRPRRGHEVSAPKKATGRQAVP
jgi:hypothetical protein